MYWTHPSLLFQNLNTPTHKASAVGWVDGRTLTS